VDFNEKGDQALTVKKPDGDEVKSRLQDGIFTFAETDIAGIYQVIGKGIDEKFSVNLLNEAESDIKPIDKITISGQEEQVTDSSWTINRELWSIFILIAVILLAFEWWVYHRRVLV